MIPKWCCLILLVVLPTAQAWGNDGHQIIATIAQSRLTATAQKKITLLLNNQNMSSVATWADSVRKTPEWSWSAPLHFINVPDGKCSFSYTRDCKKDFCCAGAILNFTKQMLLSTELEMETETETETETSAAAAAAAAAAVKVTALDAAKFVIHFVGDIHQPLHTAWKSDRGGNNDIVTLGTWDNYCSHYPPVNLHHVCELFIFFLLSGYSQ